MKAQLAGMDQVVVQAPPPRMQRNLRGIFCRVVAIGLARYLLNRQSSQPLVPDRSSLQTKFFTQQRIHDLRTGAASCRLHHLTNEPS